MKKRIRFFFVLVLLLISINLSADFELVIQQFGLHMSDPIKAVKILGPWKSIDFINKLNNSGLINDPEEYYIA